MLCELQGYTNGKDVIQTHEVMQIIMISDMINAEVANVAFGVNENYQWQLLDLILQANKVVF